MDKKNQSKPLADRRAEEDAPQEDAEPDFGDEHTPGPTDPANATADAPGGEDEGYSPQTEIPKGP